MSNCLICGSTVLKKVDGDGKAINYATYKNVPYVMCPTCIKKTIMSYVAMLEKGTPNQVETVRQIMQGIANDNTVRFTGEREENAVV